MNKTRVLALVCCSIMGLAADAQNLLLNGSFESPIIPTNTTAITIPNSWQGNASTRIINGNYGGAEYPGPQDGQQYASLGNDGQRAFISQTFTITTSGNYTLTWFASGGDATLGSPYSVAVLGSHGAVANEAYMAYNQTQGWVSKSIQLILTPGSYTVDFHSEQPVNGGHSVQIDNVSLQVNLLLNGSFESPVIPTDTTAIAIPSSWQGNASTRIINGNYGGAEFPGPQDGQQYASLGNDGQRAFISQAFTITTSGSYTLTWSASGGDATLGSPYSVAVLGSNGAVANEVYKAYNQTQGWLSKSIQLNLTAGSYTVTFHSEQPVNGGYSVQIDNVSLQADNNSDLRSTIHCAAVDICWAGRTNQMYQVQYQTTLSDTNWFDLGSPTLGSGTNCVTDAINGSQRRFYKVIRVP